MAIQEQDRIVNAKINGEDVEVYIASPTAKQMREARRIRAVAYKEALESGAMLRVQAQEWMKRNNVWDDEKQKKYSTLLAEIDNNEKILAKGGIKLSAAKDIALKIADLRNDLRALAMERIQVDSDTCEGMADNDMFNYLVSVCCVKNSDRKTPIFKNLDDYINRSTEDYAITISGQFAKLQYNTIGSDQTLPENQFLKKYKFSDEKFRLVESETGRLINRDGKYVDESGRLIAYRDDGTTYFVTASGEEIDEEGNYVVEFSPFLSENDEPIPEPTDEISVEPVVEVEAKPDKK